MNLKLRLERLCDAKQWTKLHFSDGTSIVGRMLRQGHDYVELESYGDNDTPDHRNCSRHLVPLLLIKYVTVESSTFAELERQRLQFQAQVEDSSVIDSA